MKNIPYDDDDCKHEDDMHTGNRELLPTWRISEIQLNNSFEKPELISQEYKINETWTDEVPQNALNYFTV